MRVIITIFWMCELPFVLSSDGCVNHRSLCFVVSVELPEPNQQRPEKKGSWETKSAMKETYQPSP